MDIVLWAPKPCSKTYTKLWQVSLLRGLWELTGPSARLRSDLTAWTFGGLLWIWACTVYNH